MADFKDRFEENVSGPFYVDDQCIDCDLCRNRVPEVFARNEEGAHSYVTRQPRTPAEMEESILAMEDCPVEAIGNDGAPLGVSHAPERGASH